MHLREPRVAPLPESDWTDEHRRVLRPMTSGGPILNIFRTLANDVEALKAFLAWGGYVLSRKNALPPRERELAILRTGWLCKSGYEWTQHVEIARRWGVTDAEIAAVKAGPEASLWSPADAAILRATDELHEGQFISDAAWSALSAYFTVKQRMDLVFTVGQYTQVSMILNSFGVQLDEGQVLDKDLDRRRP